MGGGGKRATWGLRSQTPGPNGPHPNRGLGLKLFFGTKLNDSAGSEQIKENGGREAVHEYQSGLLATPLRKRRGRRKEDCERKKAQWRGL